MESMDCTIAEWCRACEEDSAENLCKRADELTHLVKQCSNCAEKSLTDALRNGLKNVTRKCWDIIGDPPTPGKPLKCTSPAHLGALRLYHVICSNGLTDGPAPGACQFPGDVTEFATVGSAEVEVVHDSCGGWDGRTEYHPTGCYVPPGQWLGVQHVHPSGDGGTEVGQGWIVRIGCHTDDLHHHVTGKCLRRHPRIHQDRVCCSGADVQMFAPYGGLIYVAKNRAANTTSSCKAKIRFTNVVKALHFDVQKPATLDAWEQEKQAPAAPWADLCGQFITFTVPVTAVQHLSAKQLQAILGKFDQLIQCYYELCPRGPVRREWVVADTQISAGWLHAGYPVMAPLELATPGNTEFMLSLENFDAERFGHWGLFHELGHNMQRERWTWGEMVEVTCNVFTYYGIYRLLGIRPLDCFRFHQETPPNILKAYLDSGDHAGNPFVLLVFYLHFVNGFGWDALREVFKHYEQDPELVKLDKASRQERIDAWCAQTSRVAGYNLAPLHALWRLDVSRGVHQQLSHLTPALPDDQLTALSENRVTAIRNQFSGLQLIQAKGP